MTGLLRAELRKIRTTRATFGLVLAMVGLLALVVTLHASLVPTRDATAGGERHIYGWGGLGVLFAALLGAMSITGELRHGTIRPTLLITPRRRRVLAAKAAISALAGAGCGLLAQVLTLALAALVLRIRALPVHITAHDAWQHILGGTASAALWATIGLGGGALVRNQVATLVGLCAWLLFLEHVLLDAAPATIRYFPGTAADALTGTTFTGDAPASPGLLSPTIGALLVAAYALSALGAGVFSTERRDIP